MQRILLFFVLLVSLFPTVAGVAFASDCTGVGDSVAGCLSQHASAVESAGGITLANSQNEAALLLLLAWGSFSRRRHQLL